MDTLASLALATEPPTDALLQRPPFPPGASIISKVRNLTVYTPLTCLENDQAHFGTICLPNDRYLPRFVHGI